MPKDNKKIFVTVRTPDQTLFSGEALSLSSYNLLGPFDVLPQHSNFITLIKDKIEIRTLRKQKLEFKAQTGVIKNRGNKVQVFLGIENL